MQIKLTSIPVDDQDKALAFYTGMLGFVKAADIEMGPLRWLTVSAPEGAEGVELLLEKTDFPPSQTYQQARSSAGIPAIAFTSSDIHAEFQGLTKKGVRFHGEPRDLGPIYSAMFEDGCGNLIHLFQPKV